MKSCAAGHNYIPGNGCPECHRIWSRERRRKEYAMNPLAREREKAYQRTRRRLDPVQTKAIQDRSREKAKARRRTDAKWRALKNSAKRERWRRVNARPEAKAKRNARFRERYQNDAAFREAWNARTQRAARAEHRKAQARLNACKRRAAKRSVGGEGLTLAQWNAICAEWTGDGGLVHCAYCGSTRRIEIDHVVPLALGGRDDTANVLPACKSCNSSKRDALIWDWSRAAAMMPPELYQRLVEHSRNALSRSAA